MPRMVSRKSAYVKAALRRKLRRTNDKRLAIRIRIVLMLEDGMKHREIASIVGCSVSTVQRVKIKYEEQSIPGLLDRREDNGDLKLTDELLSELVELVFKTPLEFGYDRPTWTRELLVIVLKKRTGVCIHVGTMSRALRKIGARRGRPRPIVACPWSRAAKTKRMKAISQMRSQCNRHDVVVYEDEVDVHLNPKIGLDWMNRGHQKTVLTPGQNQKRYVAGALNDKTGELTIVEGEKKNSSLFVLLLEALTEQYPNARRIHVILDNYRIHSSQLVNAALAHHLKKIKLHFLPPYSPNENRIERVWKDLHDQVTRNHQHKTIEGLMNAVRSFVKKRNKGTTKQKSTAKAA